MKNTGKQFDFNAEKERLRIWGINITRSHKEYRGLYTEFLNWKNELTDLLNKIEADEQADSFFFGNGLPPLPTSKNLFGEKAVKILKDEVKRLVLLIPKLLYDEDNVSKKQLPDTSHLASSQINYNQNTGIGYADNKRFKFKNHQPEFFVFAEMYQNINKPVLKNRVLELSGHKEDANEGGFEKLADSPRRKSSISVSSTYLVNELAKKMRTRTGLNTDQIVNNNCDLTLVGERLEIVPK